MIQKYESWQEVTQRHFLSFLLRQAGDDLSDWDIFVLLREVLHELFDCVCFCDFIIELSFLLFRYFLGDFVYFLKSLF